jgi:hypothetical protein
MISRENSSGTSGGNPVAIGQNASGEPLSGELGEFQFIVLFQ